MEQDNSPEEQLSSACLDGKKEKTEEKKAVRPNVFDDDDCGINFIGSR